VPFIARQLPEEARQKDALPAIALNLDSNRISRMKIKVKKDPISVKKP
jgi:hypothetical protein